jgi:hypothetical protein
MTEQRSWPAQFYTFKDCLARRIISKTPPLDTQEGVSELDDFTFYLASEVWPTLPSSSIREATYESRSSVPDISTISFDATPTSFVDTLISYGISPDPEVAIEFLRKTVEDYTKEACSPPPVWSSTRTQDCEICEREGVNRFILPLFPRPIVFLSSSNLSPLDTPINACQGLEEEMASGGHVELGCLVMPVRPFPILRKCS